MYQPVPTTYQSWNINALFQLPFSLSQRPFFFSIHPNTPFIKYPFISLASTTQPKNFSISCLFFQSLCLRFQLSMADLDHSSSDDVSVDSRGTYLFSKSMALIFLLLFSILQWLTLISPLLISAIHLLDFFF